MYRPDKPDRFEDYSFNLIDRYLAISNGSITGLAQASAVGPDRGDMGRSGAWQRDAPVRVKFLAEPVPLVASVAGSRDNGAEALPAWSGGRLILLDEHRESRQVAASKELSS